MSRVHEQNHNNGVRILSSCGAWQLVKGSWAVVGEDWSVSAAAAAPAPAGAKAADSEDLMQRRAESSRMERGCVRALSVCLDQDRIGLAVQD
jgi:hypothetical protein